MRRRRLLQGSAAAALAALTGCGSAAGPAGQTVPTPSQETPVGFLNPVYDLNFPDPMIITGPDRTAWVFATNGDGGNVQVLRSPDYVSWTPADDALPQLPAWSAPGKVWAPEVAVHADDRYVMYFTTRGPNPDLQSVAVAVSSTPEGPYEPHGQGPLVYEEDAGGSIDAHAFHAADGRRFLYWKNDGNAVGADSYISVAPLSADGLTLSGKPKRLFKQDLAWEGALVEGPFVWEDAGLFHLFYSGNDYGSDAYAVGHAVADDPLGPFEKDAEPVLQSNDVAAGPGHNALFRHGERVWTVYHAWNPDAINEEPGRLMWLSEVTFDGRSASVVPPTVDYPVHP